MPSRLPRLLLRRPLRLLRLPPTPLLLLLLRKLLLPLLRRHPLRSPLSKQGFTTKKFEAVPAVRLEQLLYFIIINNVLRLCHNVTIRYSQQRRDKSHMSSKTYYNMKKILIVLAFTCILMSSCKKDREQTIEEEIVAIDDNIRNSEVVDTLVDADAVGAAPEATEEDLSPDPE